MQATQSRYRPDEIVTWSRIENETRTERRVAFLRYLPGSAEAVVAFGHTAEGNPVRYTVNVRELSRAQPASHPWFLPTRIEPPKPPDPLSETEITQRITQRREALSEAHSRARQARDAVTSAQTLAERAQTEFGQAKAALATLDRHDRAAQHNLEQAIRTGQPEGNGVDHHLADRQYVVDRVRMTEAVLTKLKSELSSATATLSDALNAVRKAAIQVVAAMLDRDVEQLRTLEDYALRFRADLLAVSTWWPSVEDKAIPIARSSAVLLERVPDFDRAKLLTNTTQATAPFKAVLEELIQGNADADFRLEK